MKTGRLAALMRHFLPASHRRGDPESGNLTLNLLRSREHIWIVSSAVYMYNVPPPSSHDIAPLSLLSRRFFALPAAFFGLRSPFLHNRYIVSAPG